MASSRPTGAGRQILRDDYHHPHKTPPRPPDAPYYFEKNRKNLKSHGTGGCGEKKGRFRDGSVQETANPVHPVSGGKRQAEINLGGGGEAQTWMHASSHCTGWDHPPIQVEPSSRLIKGGPSGEFRSSDVGCLREGEAPSEPLPNAGSDGASPSKEPGGPDLVRRSNAATTQASRFNDGVSRGAAEGAERDRDNSVASPPFGAWSA